MNGSRSLDAPEFLIPKEDDPVDFLRRMGEKANPDAMSEWEYQHYLSTVFHRPVPLATQAAGKLTRAGECLKVLSDGLWHSTAELNGPKTGSEGTRRVRELRAKGYRIEARRIAGRASWEYRLCC